MCAGALAFFFVFLYRGWGARQPDRSELADGSRGCPSRCRLRLRMLELGGCVERGAVRTVEWHFRRSCHLSGARAGADGEKVGEATLAIVPKGACKLWSHCDSLRPGRRGNSHSAFLFHTSPKYHNSTHTYLNQQIYTRNSKHTQTNPHMTQKAQSQHP